MAEKRYIDRLEIYLPTVQVHFYTEGGTISVDNANSGGEQTLISCQTYKDINQAAGTFLIHLVDAERFDKILSPMDLVAIKMSTHSPLTPPTGSFAKTKDEITHATMIGLIDRVHRKRLIDPTSGKPQVFCEIRGRDFGKLFVRHQIRYIPWLQDQIAGEMMLGPAIAMFKALLSGLSTGGPVDFLVGNNLRRLFTNGIDATFPFGKVGIQIGDAVSYRANKDLGVIPYNLPLQSQEGSFWQVLQNFANVPFNEMFFDTVNNPHRVIENDENSPHSSPLEGDSVENLKRLVRDQIGQANGVIKENLTKRYGVDASKVRTAQRFNINNGNPENCNAYTMLFLRRTPFDNSDWKKLPRYFISNADIQEQDIGKSDEETYNFFWTYPLIAIPSDIEMKGMAMRPLLFTRQRQYTESAADSTGYPKAVVLRATDDKTEKVTEDKSLASVHARIASRNAVEKYGFLPLELKTRLWKFTDNEKMGGVLEVGHALSLALANWYKHNSFLKSGSMTIKGAPDLHVGNILVNVDEKEEYYVEGVANNYVQYQPMTTTVMITRGQPQMRTPGAIDWGDAYTSLVKAFPLTPGQLSDKRDQ